MDRQPRGRPPLTTANAYYIGVDVGTSGVRAVAIDSHGKWLGSSRQALPTPRSPRSGWHEQDPELWWDALLRVLHALIDSVGGNPAALAIDGTSGTVLVTDPGGAPISPGLMYSDRRAVPETARIAAVAPASAAVHSPSASLPKLLWLLRKYPHAARALHQSEWLSGRLAWRFDLGDENNQLKMGFDPALRQWPAWLTQFDGVRPVLPRVGRPGQVLGEMRAEWADQLGLTRPPRVLLGTTDSTASLIAALPRIEPGAAATSLGSTLVVKIVSEHPVSAPEYGVYSHRLGDLWLVGGASNCGGSILARHFSASELAEYGERIDPTRRSGLDYYPLPEAGERFPIQDPELQPRIEPIPRDRGRFLQGLLEGLAEVEALGYQRLRALGAGFPSRIVTTGGGAENQQWRRIRQARIGVTISVAKQTEAAYGTALLAAGLALPATRGAR